MVERSPTAFSGDLQRSETPLPTHPDQLTPEHLTRIVSEMHPGTTVERIDVRDAVGIGGMVSTAGRGKLTLTYGQGSPALPQSVQVKMIVGERSQVPSFVYETEVNVYRKMLPGLPIERALCLGAAYHERTETFVLLLEDLTLRGARFASVLDPSFTADEVGELLDQLAVLHAHFWQSSRLDDESGWLSSHTSGPQFEIFDAGRIVRLLETNIAASTYRQDFITRVGHSAAELWEFVKAVHRHQARSIPLTLCHGDTGAHNSYRLPGGGAGYVDWQLSVKAAWPHDVHYLICTALSIADRRRHERDLVARYLAKLASLGVDYTPSLDEAMAEYSLAMIWGLTIGWFIVPEHMYGMEIITTNVERLFAAANDHNVIARARALA